MKDNERPNLKQIRIKQTICDRLDERKGKDDSYTDVLKALLDENKYLKEYVEELRHDKEMLMRIAMQTPDAIAFPNIAHYVYFTLSNVLNDSMLSNYGQIKYMKMYLKPSLEKDPKEVLKHVKEFSNEYEEHKDILINIVMWIEKTYCIE